MNPSKWDLLLDQKPVPVQEHLLAECAKLFAKDLKQWPPPLEVESTELATLLESNPQAPNDDLKREAFRLARWDLQRDLDASDDYLRNRRWLEHGLMVTDKPMLLFYSRFIEEQLYALGEYTAGRIDRKGLLQVLDLTERAVLKVETV